MKRLLLLLLILILGNLIHAQTLSEQLWDKVKTCQSEFEDMDEDGKIDYDEIIDDSKNGYLKISGSWPTCGCGCTSTVGAFKNSKGIFTFLQKDTWSCSWVHKIQSNRKLTDVFPEFFGYNSFAPNVDIPFDAERAYFFIDIEIPRFGTDTKVTLKLIPFGLILKSDKFICYEYSESEGMSNCKSIWRISSLVNNFSDSNSLENLLKADYNKIIAQDKALINEAIGNDASRFISIKELSEQIRELKEVYDLYSLIVHKDLLLGWDRNKARFYIKSKGEKPKKVTFKEFLINMQYWSPVC